MPGFSLFSRLRIWIVLLGATTVALTALPATVSADVVPTPPPNSELPAPGGDGPWVGSLTVTDVNQSGSLEGGDYSYSTFRLHAVTTAAPSGLAGITTLVGNVAWNLFRHDVDEGHPTCFIDQTGQGVSGNEILPFELNSIPPDAGGDYGLDGRFPQVRILLPISFAGTRWNPFLFPPRCEPIEPSVVANTYYNVNGLINGLHSTSTDVVYDTITHGNANSFVTISVAMRRRTDCNQSVDTDQGGVSDCKEIDDGTDPFDPADDKKFYPRPKSASPVGVSLVPAYQPCASGSSNRTHGPPLAYGSCNPPQQASSQLTVGTPDANGAKVNAFGSVTLNAILGNESTPADEANVSIQTAITDVRRRSNLQDYTGELESRLTVRLTDRTAAGSAGEPLTTDFLVRATVPCTATASTTIGSTCSVSTTADSLLPGLVPESRGTIWGLDRVQVYDGGSDGDADTLGDNEVFMTQGVFVP